MSNNSQLFPPNPSPCCPVTGLPITTKPEWTRIQLDTDFHVTFSIIGKAIFQASLSGKSSDEGTRDLLRRRTEIIHEVGLADKNYVELRDYSSLIGTPSKAGRMAVVNYLTKEGKEGHLLGFWVYGPPLAIRFMLQAGLSLCRFAIPVGIAKDYGEAVRIASKVLMKNGVDAGSPHRPRLKKDGWALELEGYGISFELMEDDIVYSISRGQLRESHVEQVIDLHEKVLQEAGLTKRGYYYRIINWEGLDRSTWKVRRMSLERLKELNKKTPCRSTVIFGLNKSMKTLVAVSSPFSSSPVRIADDLQGALEITERERERRISAGSVRKRQKPGARSYTEEQLKGFSNEMLQVIGGINWDQAGISLEGISEEHPLKPVLDALAVIKQDLDDLLQEKERSQIALQKSEEKYRTILESIEEAYFEVDLEGSFTFFNNSLSKILGYSKDELMGMNYRDYMPPRTSEEVFCLFNQVYKTGKPGRIHGYEVIRKDGTHGFHELVASLMGDQNGKPIGFRGIAHDITDSTRAEDALQKSEERFRSLVETSSDWIWETDAEGKYTYASPRVHDLLGYEPEEVIGRTPFDLMAPPEREHLATAFACIIEERRPFFNLENINLHPGLCDLSAPPVPEGCVSVRRQDPGSPFPGGREGTA